MKKPFSIIKINYFTYSILDGDSRHYQMVTKEEKEDKFEFQARAQAICDALNLNKKCPHCLSNDCFCSDFDTSADIGAK